MYQVIKAVLKDAADTTRISLIYANQTEADILLREELDEMANNHPQRFKVGVHCSHIVDSGRQAAARLIWSTTVLTITFCNTQQCNAG
jgi:ferredoxin-NADP reductase